MSPRVVIPLGSLHLSGGVKVLVLIANAMASDGWRVTFIVPDYAAHSPFPLDSGIRVLVLSTGPSRSPQWFHKTLYYLKLSWNAAWDADLCLANYYLTAYCAFFCRFLRRTKTKIFWYIQGYEAGSHGLLADAGPISRFTRYVMARLSYSLPIPVFCVSNWVKNQIGRTDAQVIHPPALDLQTFSPQGRQETKRDTIVIGTIGRQGETKGYGDFLRALEKLPDLRGIRVLVASPIPGEVSLPRGVSAEAVCAQSPQAMADFYRRCDIFILSSRMEGFPLPGLEAMACGCALLTTACGGISEYVIEESNALVVPTRSPQELADSLWQLCQNHLLRQQLSREGQNTAQRFGQEAMVAHFIQRMWAIIPAMQSSTFDIM